MKAGNFPVLRMWRYKQPGFALHLLCELQKQQQCSLHCDVLLQTEGVSIPAHSCVLSALSPVFYRAFANSPSLSVGQSRLVQLEAIGAHALMKLVGFMYSGVMEGESLDEQQEVIDIAYSLGFSNFMEGKQKQVSRHQNKTASWRDIGLQTEDTGGRKKDASIQILPKKPNFSHSGTQTDSTETQFTDTCVASVPELSIDLPDKITDVAREYNSIPPDTSLARIDEIVAHSLSKTTEALVRVHAKRQQTQKEKKRTKNSKKGGTRISLKIKLKRQGSGELWEIVSVQEESTKTCGSPDDPPVTHSLAETYKSSAEVQLSPSPSLTYQNLETVTLTPPSELTTPIPATPVRPSLEHFCPHVPDLSAVSSTLQMPPQTPDLSQPKEPIEHIAKLLGMVTDGLNVLPSVATEGNSSMPAHLPQKLEKCAAVTNSPSSYLCLLGHNLEAMESGTTSGPSEQREAGLEDLASCRKLDHKNVASVASNPTSLSSTSPCMAKKDIDSSNAPSCPMTDIVPLKHLNVVEVKSVLNNAFWGADTYSQVRKQTSDDCGMQPHTSNNPLPEGEQCTKQILVTDQVSLWQSLNVGQAPNSDNWWNFSEMRLPRCLSPLESEAEEITGISTPNLLRPHDISASQINLQPTLRCTSFPVQFQTHPGKTIQQNSSSTSQHEIQFSGVEKNLSPLRSNRDHNGGSSEYKSKQEKTHMPDFNNDLRKRTNDKMLDKQMSESVVSNSVETDNEPYRKKAKVSYTNEVDTRAEKIVEPCSIRQIDNVQDISNPVTSEKMDGLKASKTRNKVPLDQKSHKNMTLCQISPPFKCKGQESCQKDTKQPASLVTKCKLMKPIQKRTCTKAQMEHLRKIRLNTSSSCSHHDLHLTQMDKDCTPRHGNRRPSNVQHPLDLAQNITKIKDVVKECEKNNRFIEPERVTPENEQPKGLASLSKKKDLCDNIFDQTAIPPDPTVNQHFAVNQQQSVLQKSDRKIRTSLPKKLVHKNIRQSLEPEHLSAELMMDSNNQKNKDTTQESKMEKGVPGTENPNDILNKSTTKNVGLNNNADSEQDESLSRNVNGCLVNGHFVREAEVSVNTGLSIHEDVDLNAASCLCPFSTVRDFNNNVGVENHPQFESSTPLLCPFRPKTMMEKPKVDERITESLCKVSYKTTEDKLIKAKELHSEGTQIGNLEGQEGENKENAVRRMEHEEISRMNDNEAEISDIDIDVVDESLQLFTDPGDEVIATAGNVGGDDVVENQNSAVMDNNRQANEEELNGQLVLRTEFEFMPPDEATVDMTSEMTNTEASSIPHRGEPDLSSFPVSTVGLLSVFLPNLNTESAENCSGAEEELVVDDLSDSPHQPFTVVGTPCKIILEEEDEWRDEEEEGEVDVTGEESN